MSQVTEQRVPCLGPRLLPPRAFLSAQGCLSDLPLSRVWKRVCVWGGRGQGACRELHEGQGWVPGQPTNSDSRLVFCGGLSVPWKGTEGSVRHSVCPQQALHLGLNMGNMSPSKANCRHLPTHTKLLNPAHKPSTLPPCLFPEVAVSYSHFSLPPQSFLALLLSLLHQRLSHPVSQPAAWEKRAQAKQGKRQDRQVAQQDQNAMPPLSRRGRTVVHSHPSLPELSPAGATDSRARTDISSSQSGGRKAGISDPQLPNGKTQVQRRVMMDTWSHTAGMRRSP